MGIRYCNKCGGTIYSDLYNGKCSKCGDGNISNIWNGKRFQKNQMVTTEYGKGKIIDIDIPLSKTIWRWVILIKEPTKSHFLIDEGKPMCFFDKEIKGLIS